MKMATIQRLAGQHPMRKLCRVLGLARSTYYAAQSKPARLRAVANARLDTKARELFEASGRTYGSPRLAVALRRAGEPCGRHRIARLMRRAGLRARQKRRFRPRTTDNRHPCPSRPTTWPSDPPRPRDRARCGRPTSPISPPKRVGFTSPGFWMRARAGSWAGPRMTRCPPPWWPAPSSAPSQRSDLPSGCSTTRIAAAGTPATPTVNCCAATASC